MRRVDMDRYDDRITLRCNVVEAYDKLLEFIAKHLPDKFYMIGDQRVSLREKLFREIVANMLIHREFTNAFPASLIIYNDRVETKNPLLIGICTKTGGLWPVAIFNPYGRWEVFWFNRRPFLPYVV